MGDVFAEGTPNIICRNTNFTNIKISPLKEEICKLHIYLLFYISGSEVGHGGIICCIFKFLHKREWSDQEE